MSGFFHVHGQDGAGAEYAVADPGALGEDGRGRVGRKTAVGGGDVLPGLAEQGLTGRGGVLKELAVDVQDEPGGVAGGAVKVSALGHGEIKALTGPRQGHEGKAAFLLHFGPCVGAPGGENALVHGAEEHTGELETLCGVDGHKPHLVAGVAGVLICKEGHVGKVGLDGALLAAGDLVVTDGLLQLRQVVKALLTALGAEHTLVAGVVEDGAEDLGYGAGGAGAGPVVDEGDKGARSGAGHYLVVTAELEGVIKRAVVLHSDGAKVLHTALAQVPPGDVGDPGEGEVVLIDGHAQIGEGVLYLTALEKPDAAVYGVWDVEVGKDLLELPGDIVGAVEDGNVAVVKAGFVEPGYLGGDEGGLRPGVRGGVGDDAVAGGEDGTQVLLHTEAVFGDQGVGDGKYLRGGAVVVRHHNRPGAGKVLVEVKKVLHIGAAPGVYGLVRVPHDEKVSVVAGKDLH